MTEQIGNDAGPQAPFDLAKKLHQHELAHQVASVSGGGALVAPVVIDLDPTTACDLACSGCISSEVLHSRRFSEARLIEIAREAVTLGVRGVVLIGGGEPLLHSGTSRAVKVLSDAGVQVGLVTNGTLLHNHHTELQDRLAWLRISMDAGTRAVYEQVRPARTLGRDVFEKVVANLEFAARGYSGLVGASFVVFSGRNAVTGRSPNVGDVLNAARLVKRVGGAYLELKPELDAQHRIVPLTAEDETILGEQLNELTSLQDGRFTLVASSGLRSLRSSAFAVDEPKDYRECPVAELRSLVTPHGAYVCTYHRGKPQAWLGDPQTDSLHEIWSRRPRRSVLDPSESCRFHCAHHEQNMDLIRADGELPVPASEPQHSFDPFL